MTHLVQTNMIVYVFLILIPDPSSWLFTAADLLHAAKDVTTDTCACVCKCNSGDVCRVHNVWRHQPVLFRLSILAYSQICSSVKRSPAQTGLNRPTPHLHPSLRLSSNLTLLYKILQTDIPLTWQSRSSSPPRSILCNTGVLKDPYQWAVRFQRCLLNYKNSVQGNGIK